ncbi:MAG: hypothetical protein OEO21_09180, partial [Candidatus Krumholzibacteria bacterium]|nr:hypothetical protein [Candidatus Krumholzibacteria bacterium]
NQSFTPEEIAVLEAAGDDPAAAVTGGVTAVPPGEGEYVLVPADTVAGTPAFFAFDDTTGSYLVTFIEVTVGEGDYVLGGISSSGRRYYRYAIAGQGNYVVGKQLPLPESVRLVAARVARASERGLAVDAEWNTSVYDRNLFSTVGDGDNVGHAGRARVGYEGIPVGLGRLGLAVSASALDERFKSFDRARPRFFYRDWNLENVALAGREVIAEAEARVSRGERAALRYTLSRLSREDPAGDFDGAKHEGHLLLGRVGDRGVAVRAFDTTTERAQETRTRRHLRAQASLGAWKLVPTLLYGTERYHADPAPAAPDSGIAYELVGARLANRNQERVVLSLDVERRDTEETNSRTDGWRDTRRDETVTAAAAARGLRGVQGEIQLTRRVETDRLTGARADTDLGRLKSTIRGERAGIVSDVDYEVSRTAARTLERSVVFVGEGNGDYNAQGDLVGKGKGAYTVVYSPTTTSIPIRRVGLNFRFVWRAPERARGGGVWAWIAENVALDQTIGVQEETSHEPAWELYLLVPSALQRDDATLFGSTKIRQDWSLLRSRRNLGLVFRYRREDTEDNRFQGVRENRFFGEHALRLSRSLSQRLTGTGEVSRAAERRDGEGLPEATGAAYDVAALTLLAGVGVRVGDGSTIDVDLKATSQEDATSGAAQTLLAFQPRVVWRVGERINVFASYDLTQTWDRVTAPVRPVRFSDEGAAHRWTVTPNMRLARVISIVAAYTGRSETTFGGARVTRHELRLETRAIF